MSLAQTIAAAAARLLKEQGKGKRNKDKEPEQAEKRAASTKKKSRK